MGRSGYLVLQQFIEVMVALAMYLTQKRGNSVVTERNMKNLKNKIYKHMMAVLKNVYIDKLDEKVDKYINRYHKKIKRPWTLNQIRVLSKA